MQKRWHLMIIFYLHCSDVIRYSSHHSIESYLFHIYFFQSSWRFEEIDMEWIWFNRHITGLINPCHAESILGNIKVFAFSIISWHWDGTGRWNPCSWNTGISLSWMVNIMVADGLATQEARASTAMVLTQLSQNTEGLTVGNVFDIKPQHNYGNRCFS